MKAYFKNWNISRVLRLILGIAVIVQGVLVKDWMFIILGGLFSLMPLLNQRCNSSTGCDLPSKRYRRNE